MSNDTPIALCSMPHGLDIEAERAGMLLEVLTAHMLPESLLEGSPEPPADPVEG